MRTRIVALMAAGLLGASAQALAAGRVVVLPITSGAPSPGAQRMSGAVAEGLTANKRWGVVAGSALRSAADGVAADAAPPTPADWQRLGAQLDDIAGKTPSADTASALQAVRDEIRRAFAAGPFSADGASLLERAGWALASSYAAAGDKEHARAAAAETRLLFPGGTAPASVPGDVAAPAGGAAGEGLVATLKVQSNPPGCDVFVNGRAAGKSPVDVVAKAGEPYFAWAQCGARRTRVHRLQPSAQAAARSEVLDADFDDALEWGTETHLRFPSPAARRELEETYARRAADLFEADAVVFVSEGELAGADYVRATLYLSNGLLVRQGLARLEAPRCKSLGAFLATGRKAPEVLDPDEARLLVAASGSGGGGAAAPPGVTTLPWYTDKLGWALTGSGVVATTAGIVLGVTADRNARDADASRDPDRAKDLRTTADDQRFYGHILLGAGAMMLVTGIVMLVIPEQAVAGEHVALAPLPGGGGAVSLTGRF